MSVKDAFLGRLLGNAGKFSDEQVAQTITLLLEHGASHEASDIHIEPHEAYVQVRYRIDGVLRSMHKLPLGALTALAAQLKARANLNPDDTSLPQEGVFVATIASQDFSIRVSTLPVLGGEKLVLHLVKTRQQPATLEELGFWGTTLREIQLGLTRQTGFTLVAGRKHDGVSATLHALVSLLNTPYNSVATIEDSAEQSIHGVAQTQVHHRAGISSANALRAVLKQDPNVIMVSSLPSATSTKLAVQTASSGHAVLAGAHADSAADAVATVRAFGVEPFMLGACLTMAIGQRLVRRLCPHCRERYPLTNEARKAIEQQFGVGTPAARKHVHELESQALAQHVGEETLLNTTAANLTHAWRASDQGCEHCQHRGYLGNTIIAEVITRTNHVQKAILAPDNPAVAITVAAIKDGMIPIALDGLIKALRGETSIEEVIRVLA